MSQFKTEQEKFWAEEFGDNYIYRNDNEALHRANVSFFKEVLRNAPDIHSVIEFGANIGSNLLAIEKIIPGIKMSAIEINKKAAEELDKIKGMKVYKDSILNFVPDHKRDLVLIKTVLIHINPEVLNQVYELLYRSSAKYICIAEYYNPKPTTIEYRGNKDRLFKRDFAGEMLDKFKDLILIDYGFKYHRENSMYGDINWFLLKK